MDKIERKRYFYSAKVILLSDLKKNFFTGGWRGVWVGGGGCQTLNGERALPIKTSVCKQRPLQRVCVCVGGGGGGSFRMVLCLGCLGGTVLYVCMEYHI